MTLVRVPTIEIKIEGEKESLVLTCDFVPTVGTVSKAVRERVKVHEDGVDEDDGVLYFLTESGRDLCCTSWAKVGVTWCFNIQTCIALKFSGRNTLTSIIMYRPMHCSDYHFGPRLYKKCSKVAQSHAFISWPPGARGDLAVHAQG